MCFSETELINDPENDLRVWTKSVAVSTDGLELTQDGVMGKHEGLRHDREKCARDARNIEYWAWKPGDQVTSPACRSRNIVDLLKIGYTLT